MKLYDNAISPFARKVRLVMDYKGLDYEAVDGLCEPHRTELRTINPRGEVPALVDGDVKIFNSTDIVAYLDDRYSAVSLAPEDARMRAFSRAWERCADSSVDAIVFAASLWRLGKRDDSMPEGMEIKARMDLERIYDALERDLKGRDFVCGSKISPADFALFPHIASAMSFNLSFSKEQHPSVAAWMRRLLTEDVFQADLQRLRGHVQNMDRREAASKVFWRGDRIEWLVSIGYETWFAEEVRAQRVCWPGLSIPAR